MVATKSFLRIEQDGAGWTKRRVFAKIQDRGGISDVNLQTVPIDLTTCIQLHLNPGRRSLLKLKRDRCIRDPRYSYQTAVDKALWYDGASSCLSDGEIVRGVQLANS